MALERIDGLGSIFTSSEGPLALRRQCKPCKHSSSPRAAMRPHHRPHAAAFPQYPSALTKLAFFSVLALFLMVADAFQFARPLRAAVATALRPVLRALNVPVQLWQSGATTCAA